MTADSDKLVLAYPQRDVTVLALNRTAARNAMLYESWEALDAAFDEVEGDPSRRGVVLTGAGGYFCAGGDMKTAPAHGRGATAAVGRLAIAHRVIDRIRRLSIPVIAAIEGGAAGLGWSLALACDAVIAADDAVFAAPFLRRGVVPDGGAGWLLVRQIGRLRAAEILLSGRRVGAAEALSLGLASRVVAAGTAVAEACALLADAAASPNAAELTKMLLGAAESATFDSYQDLELTSAALAQAGPEAEAARQSFRQESGSDLFDGKVVLVTGGGGGIGRAHALALAAEGARVVVNDLGSDVRGDGSSRGAADVVVREIVERGGIAVANYEDISSWDGAKRAVGSAIESFGRLDGLLNNAGNLRKGDLADLTEEDFDSIVRVHLKGSFACTTHACAYWRDRHSAGDRAGGAVVNTISDALLVSLPGYVIYGAVKGGIAHLTTAGSREAQHYNVRINAYGPRALTRMSKVAYSNPGEAAADRPHPKDPPNSSPLVVWLLSDKSSHVTGQVFQTIGGAIARCTPWRPEEVIWPRDGAVRFEVDEIGPLINARIFGSRFPDLALEEPRGWDADL